MRTYIRITKVFINMELVERLSSMGKRLN